jgi:dTDP-4-dehydrorhamnose 3,5-epimerase
VPRSPHTGSVPHVRELSVSRTAIEDLWRIAMREVTDERGVVREFYRESAFREAGLPSLGPWVQVNVTETRRGALRGLHAEDMFKLVAVVAGEAFGAYVDTRRGSPSYGTVVTVTLTPGTQLLVPRGVGNGFQSVSDAPTQYLYCFDHEWVPGMAGTAVNPLDPALGIEWPLPVDTGDPAQVSARDAALPPLAGA